MESQPFECDERSIFTNSSFEAFYTPYFEGYDYIMNERNVILNDENFRFDICQGFAAKKASDTFNLESFIFKNDNFVISSPENFEIDGKKIRYFCEASTNPTVQLDNLIDNYISYVNSKKIFATKKIFKHRFEKIMNKRRKQMRNDFFKKADACVFFHLKEIE